MQKPESKVIDDIKLQYPGRKVVPLKHTISDGAEDETIYAVAVVPNRAEWNRMRREIADEDKRATAIEQMVRSAIKFPAPADFDALLDRLPGLSSAFGGSLSKLAGAAGEAEVGNW